MKEDQYMKRFNIYETFKTNNYIKIKYKTIFYHVFYRYSSIQNIRRKSCSYIESNATFPYRILEFRTKSYLDEQKLFL